MDSFTFPLDIEGWGWKICPQEGQMDQVRQLDAGQEGSPQETTVCSFLTWVGLLSRVVTDRLYAVSMALGAQFPKLLISHMCTVITSSRQLISLRNTDARRESSCIADFLTLRGQTGICHFLPTSLTSRVSHYWILRSNLKGPDGLLLRPTPSLLWARDYH